MKASNLEVVHYYSASSLIRTTLFPSWEKSVQISEFVQISKLLNIMQNLVNYSNRTYTLTKYSNRAVTFTVRISESSD